MILLIYHDADIRSKQIARERYSSFFFNPIVKKKNFPNLIIYSIGDKKNPPTWLMKEKNDSNLRGEKNSDSEIQSVVSYTNHKTNNYLNQQI